MTGRPFTQTGRPLTQSEVDEIQKLRSLFDPGDGQKKLQDFAKWLFTTASIVGVLGAAFSNAALSTLVGSGKVLFGIAVALVAVSLGFATLALAPKWVFVNLHSRQSMSLAVQKQFDDRRWFLKLAGWCFALALIISGLAPVLSNWFAGRARQEAPAVTYTLAPTGKLDVKLLVVGASPFSSVDMALEQAPSEKGGMVAMARGITTEDGTATLTLADSIRARDGQLAITFHWVDSQGQSRNDTLRVSAH